jgi:uncharacterized protein (TIGR02996 family)
MRTAMSDEAPFLDAIRANPDDDHVRLIFADWLEERGDPRGEFIRVQYALEAPATDARRTMALRIREKELLATHARDWLGPLAELHEHITFRRGFPDEANLSVDLFLESAERLRFVPLRRVALHHRKGMLGFLDDHMPQLVECPHLAAFTGLHLQGGISDLGMRMLADSPHLAGLRELRFSHGGFDLDGIRALAASPHLHGLTSLGITATPIGDLGLQALCTALLPSLTKLRLWHCEITATGVRYLARSELLGRLTRLDLSRNKLCNPALRTLAAAPRLAKVQELRLSHTGIDSIGVRALATSRHVTGLRLLDLSDNTISVGGLAPLAASPHLSGLTDLFLRSVPINEVNRSALRHTFRCALHF